MHRFFFDETRRENDRVRLDEEESRLALQDLRLKKGARIVLLDGLGGVFDAEVLSTDKQRVIAGIVGELPDNEAHARVTLYQGLPKTGKLDAILTKCTELGVHAVQPVLFARSGPESAKNAEKGLQRLRRVARGAARQCGRGQVPMIGQIKPFQEALQRIAGHRVILALSEAGLGGRVCDALGDGPPQEIALVVGPEEGFTPEESEQLAAAGARAVALGPRTLGTETAGVAALASILTLTGDL